MVALGNCFMIFIAVSFPNQKCLNAAKHSSCEVNENNLDYIPFSHRFPLKPREQEHFLEVAQQIPPFLHGKQAQLNGYKRTKLLDQQLFLITLSLSSGFCSHCDFSSFYSTTLVCIIVLNHGKCFLVKNRKHFPCFLTVMETRQEKI